MKAVIHTSNSESAHGVSSASATKRILMADDDASFRTVGMFALKKQGYEVLSVADGSEAIEAVSTQSFDIILLDANMPGVDGFEACTRIRQQLGEQCPPIIVSTGLDDEESVSKAFDVGAADYVNKPVNWTVLAGKLKHLLATQVTVRQEESLSEEVSRVIAASSNTFLELDKEAVVTAICENVALPKAFMSGIEVGSCLLDCLPGESVNKVMDYWKRLQETGEAGPVLVSNHDEINPYVIELNFVATCAGKAVCLINDLTGNYLAEQRIFNLAFIDRVTGASNRSRLIDWMNQNVRSDNGQSCAVIRGVVSNYYDYELRLGSSGLERIAVALIDRLNNLCQPKAAARVLGKEAQTLVCRISDNEVAVAVVGEYEEQALSAFIEQLSGELSAPVILEAQSLPIQTVLGVAECKLASKDPAELLNASALAIKVKNAAGGASIFYYDEAVRNEMRVKAQMESYLQRDIEGRAFSMAYQPKVDAKSLEMVGIEALLRWDCAELGWVSPGDFIPLAEQSGLMPKLSELVVEMVLDQVVEWRGTKLENVPVAINISGAHLSTNHFACDMAQALVRRNISPHLIELEVTESIMIDGKSSALSNLEKLREHGIKISVDDFGTGYSSFSYLQSLPVDVLKIDRSFVQNINEDDKSLAIARAIVTVGRELSLQVVAEGIETVDQLETLRMLGCHIIQGYFTGRPVMPEQLMQNEEPKVYAVAS